MLVVTAFDLDPCVYQALKAGVSGFLLKDEPPSDRTQTVVLACETGLVAPYR